jgi:hypothetical protein
MNEYFFVEKSAFLYELIAMMRDEKKFEAAYEIGILLKKQADKIDHV